MHPKLAEVAWSARWNLETAPLSPLQMLLHTLPLDTGLPSKPFAQFASKLLRQQPHIQSLDLSVSLPRNAQYASSSETWRRFSCTNNRILSDTCWCMTPLWWIDPYLFFFSSLLKSTVFCFLTVDRNASSYIHAVVFTWTIGALLSSVTPVI